MARFESKAQVVKHMNNPRSSCVSYLDSIIDAPPEGCRHDPAIPLMTQTSQHTPDSIPYDLINDDPADTNDFSPVFSNTSESLQENFPGSSHTYGKGESFIDRFNHDDLAEQRSNNLYYPFASREEWELASFLLRSNMPMSEIDEFLRLHLVS